MTRLRRAASMLFGVDRAEHDFPLPFDHGIHAEGRHSGCARESTPGGARPPQEARQSDPGVRPRFPSHRPGLRRCDPAIGVQAKLDIGDIRGRNQCRKRQVERQWRRLRERSALANFFHGL